MRCYSAAYIIVSDLERPPQHESLSVQTVLGKLNTPYESIIIYYASK